MTCVTASGQSLEIVGEVKVPLKIHGFSWTWMFFASRRLGSQPILRADFISKTKMVLELSRQRCYFAFATSVIIRFREGNYYTPCSKTHPCPRVFPKYKQENVRLGKEPTLKFNPAIS